MDGEGRRRCLDRDRQQREPGRQRRVGYQVRHNTDVLPGIYGTDTLTTIGLLYETKQAVGAAAADGSAGFPTRGPGGFWLESAIHPPRRTSP